MNLAIVVVFAYVALAAADEAETKDLLTEDLERKHHKRRKPQNNGCGGYGRTFGEKFFGLHDYTYVSAPVMNYFFGCGAVPVAPAPIHPIPYPVQIGISQSQSHGHGGHGGHGGLGGHGGFGGNGGFGGHGGQGNHGFSGPGFNGQYGGYQGFNQGYSPYAQGPRPFQGVVSAAASGLGSVLADYISRPKKTYKHINKQINQVLRPIYKLF